MKNWRKVLAGESRLMPDFKRYKTDNGVELPNVAEFTEDKFPSETGDPAKVELKAFKDGVKEYESDKKREKKSKGNSALMDEQAKRKDVEQQIKDDSKLVRPSYAGKKTADKDDSSSYERYFLYRSMGVNEFKVDYTPYQGGYVSPFVVDGDDLLEHLEYFVKDTRKILGLGPKYDYNKSLPRVNPEDVSSESQNTPSTWASKKKAWMDDSPFEDTGSKMVKCPFCGHTGEEIDFPLTESGEYICPACAEIFDKDADSLSALDDNVFSSKRKRGWRRIFSDVSFKNKPDGTVQIDVSSHPNAPLAQNPNTGQPAPPSPEQVQQKEQETGVAAEASLNKQAFAQPGQRVQNVSTGQRGVVTKVEGKDIYVNLDSGSTTVWGPNEINAMTEAPSSSKDYGTSKFYAAAKKWEIKKQGDLSLIGTECNKFAGVLIEKNGTIVESYITSKNGHNWREMISEGVWDQKFEDYLKS
jgi:hypothetical protein